MYRYLISIVFVLSMTACSMTSPPLESDFLNPAREAIDAAAAAGADQHAPLELRFAREKLMAAAQANSEGDVAQARRLARQAEVDAELCTAKTAAALAREAVRTQRQANEQLKAELRPAGARR